KPTVLRAVPAPKDGEAPARHLTAPLNGDGVDNIAIADDGLLIPGVAGLPHVQRTEPTPAEAARAFRARRRLLLWAGLALLSLILVVEVLLLSPWTDPAAGQPPRQVSSIPLGLAQVHP